MNIITFFMGSDSLKKKMYSVTVLLLCFSLPLSVPILTMTPSPAVAQSGTAAQVSADVRTQARALQIEGTTLQLKGDLAGAIENYKQSIALKPNSSLEKLVDTLEHQIQHKQEAAAAAQAKKPSDGETAPIAPHEKKQASASVVVKRAPASFEEALIYSFTDWFLNFFPEKSEASDFGLVTNRNYTISKPGEQFEVRFDECRFHFDTDEFLDLSPVVLKYSPQARERLAVELSLPEEMPLKKRDKIVALLKIGGQAMTGIWNCALKNFEQSNLDISKISLEDIEKSGKLLIGMLQLSYGIEELEKGDWREAFQGGISDVLFEIKKENILFSLQDLSGMYQAGGGDYKKYTELSRLLYEKMEEFEKPEQDGVQGLADFFTALDTYIGLFASSRVVYSINGINVLEEGRSVALDSAAMGFELQKDWETGKFTGGGKGDLWNLSITEATGEGGQTQGTAQPPGGYAHIDHLYFADSANVDTLPPTLFSDLFRVYIKAGEAKAPDSYTAEQAVKYAKIFMELFDGFSGTVGLEGFKAQFPQSPVPISLDKAVISNGFKEEGKDGTLFCTIDLGGFKGIEMGDGAIPKAMNLNFKISDIPSLVALLPDPAQLSGANQSQVKGMLGMNAMGALMSSAMKLNMQNTHVTFPKSKLNLGLEAEVNGTAKMMSTGALKVAIENPDELMRIIQFHGADKNIQQVLSTLTALSNRTTEDGTVIDRVNMELNKEGKILSNGKDVTPLFFPQQ